MGAESAIGGIVAALVVLVLLSKSIKVVREKQVLVVERLGRYHTTLIAGFHFLIPFIDRPRTYDYRFWTADQATNDPILNEARNVAMISTQNEVMDFPKQKVITRDNAAIALDVLLSYKITAPRTMIYSVQNLPHMLSKLLQAQIRNVAGSLDVDQIVEDFAAMDRVCGLMDAVAVKWGVKVDMVKFQGIYMGDLDAVLAQKKQADLNNKEVIIGARGQRQTTIIDAEGRRDRMMKEAEGEAQRVLSGARGRAQAIVNEANAEAAAVTEIARAVTKNGEDPVKYLLALKYLEALREICEAPETDVTVLPHETAAVQTARDLGFSTLSGVARG